MHTFGDCVATHHRSILCLPLRLSAPQLSAMYASADGGEPVFSTSSPSDLLSLLHTMRTTPLSSHGKYLANNPATCEEALPVTLGRKHKHTHKHTKDKRQPTKQPTSAATRPTVADLVPLGGKLPRVGEQGAGEAFELPLRQAEHAQPANLADGELYGVPPLSRLRRHVQEADGTPLYHRRCYVYVLLSLSSTC